MAYQQVGGTPRFYIDIPSYFNSLGADYELLHYSEGSYTEIDDKSLFGLNPINMKTIKENIQVEFKLLCNFKHPWNTLGNSQQSYMGFINHNLNNSTYSIADADNNEGVINTEMVGNDATIPNNGFNLSIFSTNWEQNLIGASKLSPLESDGSFKNAYAGCFTLGFYYDMPVSPDLDLSMEIEFDGVNNIKTLSGHTITQANYQGSPWWYDKDGNKVEPWSVGESTGLSKRNGRRVWNLKFSYMSDKDLFASNYSAGNYLESSDGYDVTSLNTEDVTDVVDWDFSSSTGWFGSAIIDTSAETLSISTNNNGLYNFALSGGAHSSSDFPSGKQYKIFINFANVPSGAVFSMIIGSHVAINNYSPSSNTTLETYITLDSTTVDRITFQTSGAYEGSLVINSVLIARVNAIYFDKQIDNDDSFSAQVLNKISHGEKFIFQPDNTANNPSDFAIAVLDGDSFSMKRTAWNVYDIEMTIREVW